MSKSAKVVLTNAGTQFGQERPLVTYFGSKVYNPWVFFPRLTFLSRRCWRNA